MATNNNNPSKRSSRVTFSGVSSLPPQKAQTLANALQKIILTIVEVHNACEDPRMVVDDKYRKVGSLSVLSKDITNVCELVNEELTNCVESVKPDLQIRAEQINNCAKELFSLFPQLPHGDSPARPSLANSIFENLLKIVEVTIDLLKKADEGAVHKMVGYTTHTLSAVRRIRDAQNLVELTDFTPECTATSVDLVKRIANRAQVLPADVREKAETANETIKTEIPRLISIKKLVLTNPTQSESEKFASCLQKVVDALKILLEVSKVAPEFSVNFEVEYYDDALGIALSALANAVDKADEPGVLTHAKEVVAEVQRQVAQGREILVDLPPHQKAEVLDACDKSLSTVGEIVKAGRDGLRIKKETGINATTPEYLEAERRLVEYGRALRQEIVKIPVNRPLIGTSESMALLHAARNIVLNLGSLLAT